MENTVYCSYVYLIRKASGLCRSDFASILNVSENFLILLEDLEAYPSVFELRELVKLGINAYDLIRYSTTRFLKDDDLNLVSFSKYEWFENKGCFYEKY